MANTNFTGMLVVPGSTGSRDSSLPGHQLEKISYSLQSLSESDLLDLRGKRVHLVQRYDSLLADSRFFARIMAVQLPAPGSSVETSVLLLEDGYADDQMDYVDVSNLTILEVLPSPVRCEGVEDGLVAPCAAGTPSAATAVTSTLATSGATRPECPAPAADCAGLIVPS